jgi:sensor histidine kinase YesM
MAREALGMRAEGANDSYESYLKADRIAAYVDGYLGRLLSLSLAEGAAGYKEQAARSAEYRRLSLTGLVGAGALAFLFAALFAVSVSAPIKRLAGAAERIAAGELDVEAVEAKTGDEVEVLARGFNAMSASIRAMVAGLEEKAALERLLHEESLSHALMGKALREAQFMNLQDQTRPHFLFNALNTIARSALLEEARETEKLALSLGKLMRYSLAEGGTFATIREELEILREYLSFQSIRFGSRLSWSIRSEPFVEEVLIPRFTLQPIVENAVRHGIEPKEEGGKVVISARRKGDRIRLIVADSGIGMDTSFLGKLRAAARGEAVHGDGMGIGMANLEGRLAFRYPGAAILAVSSRPGRGSLVRISLPVMAVMMEAVDAD